MYSDSTKAFGKCFEMLSGDADQLIMATTPDGFYGEYSIINLAASTADLNKACRTYWIRPLNGTCGRTLTSTRKGLACLSDADCPTSDTATQASCKCGFSTKGLKYCDIEGGDTEWLAAAAAVLIYLYSL